eukprot:471216-Prymnesium_polylepis.2
MPPPVDVFSASQIVQKSYIAAARAAPASEMAASTRCTWRRWRKVAGSDASVGLTLLCERA